MKNLSLATLTFALLSVLTAGCTKMSESFDNPDAGINGGFEVEQNGYPVNWILYAPSTVPNADFTMTLDTEVFREGKKALKFDVKSCVPKGGWESPGFTNEFAVVEQFKGPATYKISMWIRNQGATYQVSSGGVTETDGGMDMFAQSSGNSEKWRRIENEVKVGEGQHLRVEFNVIEPGTIWVDDFRVEKMSN